MAPSLLNTVFGTIFLLAVNIHYMTSLATVLTHQGMGDNCVLSFVVPRDKMKSSCDVNDRIKRRVNAVDMKVNVYKQMLTSLQNQHAKERELNAQKFDNLERQLRESYGNHDASILLERRLALLEREIGQVSNPNVHGRSAQADNRETASNQAEPSFNTIDKTPVLLPNLVKSMVQAELQTVMEEYNKRMEAFVQQQILIYGQVFSMVSTPKDRTDPSWQYPQADTPSSHSDHGEHHKYSHSRDLRTQLMKMKEKFDITGDEIARKVTGYLQKPSASKTREVDFREEQKPTERSGNNIMTTTSTTTHSDELDNSSGRNNVKNVENNLNVTSDYEDLQLFNTLEEDGLEINDSLSGENPGSRKSSSSTLYTTSTSMTPDADISNGASSRISNGRGEWEKEEEQQEGIKQIEKNRWKDNMVMDQNYQEQQTEAKLLADVRSLLYQPLAEMLNLVEKKTAQIEFKLNVQDKASQQMANDFSSNLKVVGKDIESNKLQLNSISQAIQDLYSRSDRMKSIEAKMNELKTNMSARQNDMPYSVVNEQGKRVKKLERLMAIYKQSLEHYKNETKQDYIAMRESLTKETHGVKMVSQTLEKNLTQVVSGMISRFNISHWGKISNLKAGTEHLTSEYVLMKLDLKALERKVNSKSNKAEREMSDIRQNVEQFSSKSRDFKRKTESINRKINALEAKVNSSSEIITDLKTELKLSVTDTWLEINFKYDGSRSKCYGKQYVRKTRFKKAPFVGVVLCNKDRYKILLGDALENKFLNIGDGDGFGRDHCEFVGGSRRTKFTLAPYSAYFGLDRGFTRKQWGEEPVMAMINTMKPSPSWYECGVSIP